MTVIPESLVERARSEIKLFERPQVSTSKALIERVEILEAQLKRVTRERDAAECELSRHLLGESETGMASGAGSKALPAQELYQAIKDHQASYLPHRHLLNHAEMLDKFGESANKVFVEGPMGTETAVLLEDLTQAAHDLRRQAKVNTSASSDNTDTQCLDTTVEGFPPEDKDQTISNLKDALWFVLSRIDGDLHATARDINNSIGTGNDIYDDCDIIENHVRQALRDAGDEA